ELAVYNRALAATELQAIYSAGGAGKCSTLNAPSIVSQPTNQTVQVGGSASFSVVASGTAPLSYQWTHEGTNLPAGTVNPLVLANVQSSDAGIYAVVVSNVAGTILSSNATLTVVAAGSCAPVPAGLIAWWR